jgi:hypothetical protein
MVQELIKREEFKNWLLIGDSVVHGDNSIREDAIGTQLSRHHGFINLSNPSMAFQTQALLTQALREQYPSKKNTHSN